ncbi:DUF559 domain-containing protein [Conexibacter woesei]|uniref:DUF559 domain-containing protein n=1 Tax=Conexibacter woesei TaxID=191495 RepID=UPI0005A1779F|nr:DUF559 domain-containing protein [Conexibacter woesei]
MSRRQLLGLGLTPKGIEVRLRARRLLPLHRGVYAVGHARLTRQGEWLAAVLAAGPGAALSHRSAAVLYKLLPERGRRIDVTSTRRRATTNWIETHQTSALPATDLTHRDGVPVTTVTRTLVDLADVLDAGELERAVNEADVERVLDVAALGAALRRAQGRRGGGAERLRGVLAQHHGPVLLRSELERRFKALLVDHALPPAEHNVRVAGWEVDACWPAARLVVDLDSRRYHDTAAARARDARKQQELENAGWTVLRYRTRHLKGGAGATTAEELRASFRTPTRPEPSALPSVASSRRRRSRGRSAARRSGGSRS